MLRFDSGLSSRSASSPVSVGVTTGTVTVRIPSTFESANDGKIGLKSGTSYFLNSDTGFASILGADDTVAEPVTGAFDTVQEAIDKLAQAMGAIGTPVPTATPMATMTPMPTSTPLPTATAVSTQYAVHVLAQVTGIDMTDLTTRTLLTATAPVEITDVRMRATSASGVTVAPQIGIRIGGVFVFLPRTIRGFDSEGQTYTFSGEGVTRRLNTSETVELVFWIGSDGALSTTCEVLGYAIP